MALWSVDGMLENGDESCIYIVRRGVNFQYLTIDVVRKVSRRPTC